MLCLKLLKGQRVSVFLKVKTVKTNQKRSDWLFKGMTFRWLTVIMSDVFLQLDFNNSEHNWKAKWNKSWFEWASKSVHTELPSVLQWLCPKGTYSDTHSYLSLPGLRKWTRARNIDGSGRELPYFPKHWFSHRCYVVWTFAKWHGKWKEKITAFTRNLTPPVF